MANHPERIEGENQRVPLVHPLVVSHQTVLIPDWIYQLILRLVAGMVFSSLSFVNTKSFRMATRPVEGAALNEFPKLTDKTLSISQAGGPVCALEAPFIYQWGGCLVKSSEPEQSFCKVVPWVLWAAQDCVSCFHQQDSVLAPCDSCHN